MGKRRVSLVARYDHVATGRVLLRRSSTRVRVAGAGYM